MAARGVVMRGRCEGERRGREVVRYVEVVREGGEREGGGGRELEVVRQQLSMSQRENEELSQKYIAVSEKVSGRKHL